MKNTKVGKINDYNVYLLNKEITKKHISKITKIIDQIPLVKYTEKEVLAESKKERIFYGKWEHSLVVFDTNMPIAVVIGYERKTENNEQYPDNTIYISELGVDKNYQRQGIAKKLIKLFLDYSHKKGFIYLKGKVNFSIQTNSAKWNEYVQNLYKSFGFTKRAMRKYDNRIDVVLGFLPKYLNKTSKTIIFDMNGVIIDDEHIHMLAFRNVCKKYKIDLSSYFYKKLCMGRTDLDGFRKIARYFNIENLSIGKLVDEKTENYLALITDKIKSFPGVIKLIHSLGQKYTLALVSSSTKKEIDLTLAVFKITKFFKAIVSSNDIKKGKPDPEPYLLVAKKLKVQPKNCIVIEDTKAGILSAKSAGMICIAITTTNSKDNLKNANYIINKFSEVEEILERK